MSLNEELNLLSGTKEQKQTLINYLLEKLQSGQPLLEHEIPMLEYLKADLYGVSGA